MVAAACFPSFCTITILTDVIEEIHSEILYSSILCDCTYRIRNALKLSCVNMKRKVEVKLLHQRSSLHVKFDSNFTDD